MLEKTGVIRDLNLPEKAEHSREKQRERGRERERERERDYIMCITAPITFLPHKW